MGKESPGFPPYIMCGQVSLYGQGEPWFPTVYRNAGKLPCMGKGSLGKSCICAEAQTLEEVCVRLPKLSGRS